MTKQRIHWKPYPKQETALLAKEFEVGYGGSRGGGKTDCGIIWLTEPDYLNHSKYKALVIRKNSTDLDDWVSRAKYLFLPINATFVGHPPTITLPAGGYIKTGHLKDENAFEKYQGHEYQKILIEELEQIAREDSYLKLLSSCRSTVPQLRPQVFSTFNPGGPGHTWIRNRFKLSGRPDKPIITDDKQTGRRRIFIPARVDDNPALIKADPGYIQFLGGLPPGLRETWRYGDWDFVNTEDSVYYHEINAARENQRIATIPYESGMSVYTAWDLGIDDYTVIGFFQIIGREIRMIDYYQNRNYGLNHYVKILQDKGYVYSKHFLPHDIAVREYSTGRTRLETLEKLDLKNIKVVRKLDKEDVINAVRTIFNRIYFDESYCAEFLHAITQYKREYDEKLAKHQDKPLRNWASHSADMLGYFAVGYKDIANETIDRKPSEFGSRQPPPQVSRFHYTN